MTLALVVASIVLDVLTLAVFSVYAYIAFLTRRQVNASQAQVQATQATLELVQRPFIYPSGALRPHAGSTHGGRLLAC